MYIAAYQYAPFDKESRRDKAYIENVEVVHNLNDAMFCMNENEDVRIVGIVECDVDENDNPEEELTTIAQRIVEIAWNSEIGLGHDRDIILWWLRNESDVYGLTDTFEEYGIWGTV